MKNLFDLRHNILVSYAVLKLWHQLINSVLRKHSKFFDLIFISAKKSQKVNSYKKHDRSSHYSPSNIKRKKNSKIKISMLSDTLQPTLTITYNF